MKALLLVLAPTLAAAGPLHDLKTTRPLIPTAGVPQCALYDTPLIKPNEKTESLIGYNEKGLAKASIGLENPDVKHIWFWCVPKADTGTASEMAIRLWSSCVGVGDSAQCTLYAAPIVAKEQLGKVTKLETDWAPATLKTIDGKTPWGTAGLRATIDAGRGVGYLGIYLKKGELVATPTEWQEN